MSACATAEPRPMVLDGVVPYPGEVAERYRAAGHWTGQTLGGMLRASACAQPDAVAVVDGELRLTYSQLDRRADALAHGLADRGVGRGDRVVVQLPNSAAFVEAFFALTRVGAIPVFALPAHRRSEVEYFCAHSGAVAYLTVPAHDGFDHRALGHELLGTVPTLRHLILAGHDGPAAGDDASPVGEEVALDALAVDRGPFPDAAHPADVALMQLSGGTTGRPKLIPRTHDDYLYSVRASVDLCGVDRDGVYLAVLPMAHNYTMSSAGFLGALHAGATTVVARDGSPETAFPLIERHRVTHAALVPPLALVWLGSSLVARHDLSSLRVLQVGGAKLGSEVARRVRPVLGCTLQQVFGMAEGLVNYTRLDDDEETIVGTQGRPISPDDEVRVVDDEDRDVPDGTPGHLLVRGPYTIRGYYRAAEHDATAFTADGFYRTGDLVTRRPSGHLVVTGRAKDQINRGGEKIAPEEVENHLLAHPRVHDVAVVGVPDEYLGERSLAQVVLRPGAPGDRALIAELRGFLRNRGIAAYKLPDRIEFLDALPTTGVGKVSRRELVTGEDVAEGHQDDASEVSERPAGTADAR